MIDKRVAIAALARNCEDNLPGNIERIEELRKFFSASAVFIYENNSTDGTKSILKSWQQKEENVFLQVEEIDESLYQKKRKVGRLYRGTGEGRILKMCDCRNKLLELIRNHGSFDYVIFVDIDVEWFSVEGVVKSIVEAPKGWAGIFSNCYVTYRNGGMTYNNPLHYDTFGFVEKGKQPEQIKHSDLNPFKRIVLAGKIYKETNRRAYYECESAFGGIGVYKGDQIAGLRYELFKPKSWENTDSTLCEHIWFNARIAGGKFIARDLRVRYHSFNISGLQWVMVKNMPMLVSMISKMKSLLI